MIYIATDNYKDGFPLSKAYDDTIYQKGNGEYYLKFRFPVDRFGVWKHLTCETILKADDTRGLQLFKIKKINKINGYIRVYCKHISDDLNYIGVDKLSVTNATGRRVMEALAGSTTEPHNFIFNSDIATMHTLNLSNTTAGKILSKDKHSIIGQWGGELVRDNFLVDLKARAGVDTEILFMNKKNVKNLDNVISTENLTTRLKLSVEKEHEGKKQTITATVDSPNINAYPRIYTNYLKITNTDITTQEELIEYGKKYFRDKLVDFPTDNLTVNVIDKNQEQVRLFDTVWFRNVDFNIDKRLKVVAYEYSPMAKRYKKISFGALKVSNLSQIKSLSQLEDKIEEKVNESFVDAFKIQKNLSELLKLDRKGIEDKLVELEEKSKGALEVKKALFEADGTIPDVVKAKILDAVEGDIGRLKTIITEAELIKAIQAKLNYAEIKNALIDKAFINQIISDEKFTQQFEDGEVTTQNIFTKLKDSIKSNISKEFVTKDGVRKLVNDLTIDADGIRQITQQESQKVFNTSINGKVQEIVGEVKKNLPTKEELKGKSSYLHKKYSDYSDGRNMSDNSTLKYIGIYTGDKQQAPTNASEYSWTKIRGEDGNNGRDGERGRDGVSNYIHRKYSDYSNGASMSDNSNLKYIGIYTGTSPTPPTTASSYLWSKIKGEDGANGTPGAKGADGRTPYFHTAYSNSPTGDRDFSTTNSTGKEYIGTYSDFEIADSTDYRRYKWVKIKGEDGQDGKSINRNYILNSEKLTNINFYGTNWEKTVENGTLVFTKVRATDDSGMVIDLMTFLKDNFQNEVVTWSLDIKATKNISFNSVGQETNGIKGRVDITTKWQRISHTFTNRYTQWYNFSFYQMIGTCSPGDKIYIRLPKLEKGNVATEWSPAYEDLQAHSLTANLRFEGRYINSISTDVKPYLDVFYDGQKITSGFNAQIKYKGGNSYEWSGFREANFDNNGGITNVDWGNREQNGTPLEVIVLITYKGLNTIANARMENVPDIVEIKEITKKYKTFESTIDRFDSTIGEVKQQVLANEEKRNLIIGSRILNETDYKVFGKVWDGVSKQGIYTQIRQSTGDGVDTIHNGNSYLFVVAQNNTQNVWQGVGFNISSKILLPGRKYSLRIPYYILARHIVDKGIFAEIKNHNTGRVVWREEIPTNYKESWIEKEVTFRTDRTEYLSDYSFWIYAVQNGGFCISAPYMCEGDVLPKTYSPAPEDVHLQNSRLESSIKQTKDEIELKVSKDNVINAINISTEGTKITGTAIADYLYGKTIEGAVIQGNSKIKIGQHGYMIPVGEGLRYCLPEKPNANKGVGIQMVGNYGRNGDTAYGLYVYVDPNFDTKETAGTDAYLMTVNGYVRARGINNLKFDNYEDGSTAIGIWDKNVALLFDRTKNDIYYDWGGKIYSLWQMIDRFYSTTSDVRLKKDIKTCKYKALDLIEDFKFKSFNWKHREQLERKPFTEIGLIAQDVEKISKNFVTMSGEYKTLNQFNLLTYSLKAIQELSEENTNLKSQLNEMNERLTKLEDKINGNL